MLAGMLVRARHLYRFDHIQSASQAQRVLRSRLGRAAAGDMKEKNSCRRQRIVVH